MLHSFGAIIFVVQFKAHSSKSTCKTDKKNHAFK